MALREILKNGDPALSKKCRPVEIFDSRLHQLLDDMADTMNQANGCGLAASQVGILKRVVTIDDGNGLIELVNPEIIKTSGEQEEIEGCLSLPGIYAVTKRPNWVQVKANDRYGKQLYLEGEGLLARAFCHELDHLDGIVLTDHAKILSDEELKEYMSEDREND